IYSSRGQHLQARSALEQRLDVAYRAKNPLMAVLTLVAMAQLEEKRGNREAVLDYYERALAQSDGLADDIRRELRNNRDVARRRLRSR
ncbi:MAG TPA: hypothetical protein VEA38_23680, partial [Terriglobales bacterium]|nr:hypothetical protein [Terriglobales bacterium]